jgi:ABC-type branched-subunit amino acid transport system ATPase component
LSRPAINKPHEPVLSVRGLSKRFGGLDAVRDCSFDVHAGTVVGLIGPNGSGKSTVFNLITNMIARDAGSVSYQGTDLGPLKLFQIARLGIGRTFQEIKIFRELTVWENLGIAAQGQGLAQWEVAAEQFLHRMSLHHVAKQLADELSIGQQRLLELTMHLLVRPKLLLLDEPLAGVHPATRNQISDFIRANRETDSAVLLIEHDIRFVMDLCDRVIVMDHGDMIFEGEPKEVSHNERVLEALLGAPRKNQTQ